METPNQNEQVDTEDIVVEYIELEDIDVSDEECAPPVKVEKVVKKPVQDETIQQESEKDYAEEDNLKTEPSQKAVKNDSEDVQKTQKESTETFDYVSAEPSPTDKKRNVVREIFVYLMIIAASFLVGVFLTRFVIFNAHVPSGSMQNTIDPYDNLIGLQSAYWFSDPKQGDIIIFRYPDDTSQTFIKRVIGTPGDVVEIINGELFINNHKISEDYIKEPMVGNFGPYEVPEGCYFVLGDNRNVSQDARFWTNTYVMRDQIIAKAWFRYSPTFKNLWN